MRVIFRVDASEQIGSGHLMRCLTLAGELRKMGADDIVFVSRDLEGNMFSVIEKQGYELIVLPKHIDYVQLSGYELWLTVPQEVDARETIALLYGQEKATWLIVDSYAIDKRWEEMLRPYVEHLMAIDDLADRKHDVDVLLDQNYAPGREKDYYALVPRNCKLLMGLDYLLMRDEFYVAKKYIGKSNGEINRVFVFFGGSDLTDETSKTLDAMESFPEIFVDVVVGGSNQQAGKIADRCGIHANWHYHYQIDYIASLMGNADLAIGAGGTATWERCYLELPSLVIAIADNQSGGAEFYDSQGIWKYLGEARSVTANDIVDAIRALQIDYGSYRKMIGTARKLFQNHVQGKVASILMGRSEGDG